MKLLFLALALTSAFGADPVKVPPEFRTCVKTDDCETVPLKCGCCQYGAVAKFYVTEYLDEARKQSCIDQPCTCKPLKLKPACVKKHCELVDPHAKPAKTPARKAPKKKKKAKSASR